MDHQGPRLGGGYQIDYRQTVETRDQIEADARARRESEVQGGGWWLQAVNGMLVDIRVAGDVRNALTNDAAMLAQNATVRPAPSMPNSYYDALDHRQLQAMVTDGVDPGAVGGIGSMWKTAGVQMVDFQTKIASAINNSETEWQGQAGDQARQFMAGVANWVGQAGSDAQLAGTNIELQSDALAAAQRSMPEPVDFDANAANARLQEISNPIEFMTQATKDEAAFQAQKEAKAQAVQVMSTYDGTLASSATMPSFAPPPTLGGGTVPPPPPPPPGEVNPPGTGNVGPGGGGGGYSGTTTGMGRGTGSGTGVGGRAGSGVGMGVGTGGGTQSQGYVGGPYSPTPGGFPQGVSTGQGPNAFGGGMPVGPMGPMGGGPGGFGPGGGAGGGRGGFGPGGSGPGGGMGQQPGAGPRSGAGIGGMSAAEQAMGRGAPPAGAAGARGAAGMGGMGAGGGKGQGGEDAEHQRPSYLVEADPDDLFGTDQMTAPPVIS